MQNYLVFTGYHQESNAKESEMSTMHLSLVVSPVAPLTLVQVVDVPVGVAGVAAADLYSEYIVRMNRHEELASLHHPIPA